MTWLLTVLVLVSLVGGIAVLVGRALYRLGFQDAGAHDHDDFADQDDDPSEEEQRAIAAAIRRHPASRAPVAPLLGDPSCTPRFVPVYLPGPRTSWETEGEPPC